MAFAALTIFALACARNPAWACSLHERRLFGLRFLRGAAGSGDALTRVLRAPAQPTEKRSATGGGRAVVRRTT